MSLQQIINYNNPANFTFDANKIEVIADARLILVDNAGLSFPQLFTNDTGFVYDSSKAEFVVGEVLAKDQTGTSDVMASKFATLNLNWRKDGGSLVGSLNGTPVLSGGKVQCFGANGVYYNYTTSARESHKWIHTPNYSGVPSPNNDMLCGNNDIDSKDKFQLMHSGTGSIRLYIYNDVGASVLPLTPIAGFTPVLGTDYEMELVIDSVAGTIRLLINGILVGTLTTTPWARGGVASRVYLGAAIGGYNYGAASYDNYILFNNAQHTTDYTPGYALSDYIYLESTVELPSDDYSGVGYIQSLDDVTMNFTGLPRIILNDKYYFGGAWIASDGSYAQANTPAEYLAAQPSAEVVGDSSIQRKIIFPDSNDQSSFDQFDVEYTGQIYPVTPPYILVNSGILTDGLIVVTEDVTKAGGDDIRYCINIDGICYWNDPADSLWKVATGYPTTNTIAEINANKDSLDLEGGKTIKITALLLSADGSTTPILTSITIDYDFADEPTDPIKCVVHGTIQDVNGDPIQGATVECVPTTPFYYDEVLISALERTTTSSSGTWDMPIVENETYGGTYKFITRYESDGKEKKVTDRDVIVPNTTTKKLSEIVNQ